MLASYLETKAQNDDARIFAFSSEEATDGEGIKERRDYRKRSDSVSPADVHSYSDIEAS
jgi:hypothetical protein